MMRALILAAALTLLPLSAVNADTTITLNQSAPAYQTVVTFTITGVDKRYDCVGKSKCAHVYVACSQDVLVYGEMGDLGQARGDGSSPNGYVGFLLGGGSSIWVNERPNTAADCQATVFRYDESGPVEKYVFIASTTFEAAA